MKPTLEYRNQGRDGYVIYTDQQGSIKFYFEYGGADCVAIISVPAEENWTAETNRLLSERNTILNFVGTQAAHDQVLNGRYEINGDFIELYKND